MSDHRLDTVLERLLADAELSPAERERAEAFALRAARPLTAARSARWLGFAAAAALVVVVVVGRAEDPFTARGGAAPVRMAIRCVDAAGAAVAVDSAVPRCPAGGALGVELPGPAAVALVDTDGLLRPLSPSGDTAKDGPSRHGAALVLSPGAYALVALPGGDLPALDRAVQQGAPALLRVTLTVTVSVTP